MNRHNKDNNDANFAMRALLQNMARGGGAVSADNTKNISESQRKAGVDAIVENGSATAMSSTKTNAV